MDSIQADFQRRRRMAVEPKSELYRNMPREKIVQALEGALAFAERNLEDGRRGCYSVMISQELARRLLQILEEEGGDADG